MASSAVTIATSGCLLIISRCASGCDKEGRSWSPDGSDQHRDYIRQNTCFIAHFYIDSLAQLLINCITWYTISPYAWKYGDTQTIFIYSASIALCTWHWLFMLPRPMWCAPLWNFCCPGMKIRKKFTLCNQRVYILASNESGSSFGKILSHRNGKAGMYRESNGIDDMWMIQGAKAETSAIEVYKILTQDMDDTEYLTHNMNKPSLTTYGST